MKKPDGSFSYSSMAEHRPIPWGGDVTRKDAQSEGVSDLKVSEQKAAAAESEFAKVERVKKEGELPTLDDLETEPPLTAEQYGASYPRILLC